LPRLSAAAKLGESSARKRFSNFELNGVDVKNKIYKTPGE